MFQAAGVAYAKALWFIPGTVRRLVFPVQGVMGRVMQDGVAKLGRAGRIASAQCWFQHTLFIWLILTHPLDLSSGFPLQKALIALCTLSEACALSPKKKKYPVLGNKAKKVELSSNAYWGIV